MIEQEEKVGVWNLPEPTDAEEIAYLRHANALLRESVQHQVVLFERMSDRMQEMQDEIAVLKAMQ